MLMLGVSLHKLPLMSILIYGKHNDLVSTVRGRSNVREMVDIQRRVLKYNRASSLHVFLYVDKESRQFSHFSP